MDIFDLINKDPELRKAFVQGISNTSGKSISSICNTLNICEVCYKDNSDYHSYACLSISDTPFEAPDITTYSKEELDILANGLDKMEAVKSLISIAKRNKIQGIKVLRQLFGYGLKEAKLLFEHYLEPYLK